MHFCYRSKYTDPLTSNLLRASSWAKPLAPTALVSDTITTNWDQTLQQKASVLHNHLCPSLIFHLLLSSGWISAACCVQPLGITCYLYVYLQAHVVLPWVLVNTEQSTFRIWELPAVIAHCSYSRLADGKECEIPRTASIKQSLTLPMDHTGPVQNTGLSFPHSYICAYPVQIQRWIKLGKLSFLPLCTAVIRGRILSTVFSSTRHALILTLGKFPHFFSIQMKQFAGLQRYLHSVIL